MDPNPGPDLYELLAELTALATHLADCGALPHFQIEHVGGSWTVSIFTAPRDHQAVHILGDTPDSAAARPFGHLLITSNKSITDVIEQAIVTCNSVLFTSKELSA